MRDSIPMKLVVLAVLGVAIAALLLPNSARAGGGGGCRGLPVTGSLNVPRQCRRPLGL